MRGSGGEGKGHEKTEEKKDENHELGRERQEQTGLNNLDAGRPRTLSAEEKGLRRQKMMRVAQQVSPELIREVLRGNAGLA